MAAHQCVGVGVGGFYTTTGWIWILQEGRLRSTGTKEQWRIMWQTLFSLSGGWRYGIFVAAVFTARKDRTYGCCPLVQRAKKTRGAIKHQHGNVFNSSWCWGYYRKAENTTEGVRTYNPIQYDGISFAKLRYNWLRVLMRPDLGPNTFGTFVGLVSGRLQATATKLNWAIQAVALCRYALQFWMHTSEP